MTEEDFKQTVTLFMFAYMFELENVLFNQKEDLEIITFQQDEANTDRELKEYVKKLILADLCSLKDFEEKTLQLNLSEYKKPYELTYSFFNILEISKVYLPEEITPEIKTIIRQENKVYVKPDLLLEITDGEYITYESIELKSTRNNSIPGSSVQQITPDEWTIFIKRSPDISITTGQYINALNNTISFPDRSPRPSIAFDELESWNETNRESDSKKVSFTIDREDIAVRRKIIEDYQSQLGDVWLEVLQQKKTSKKIPWFHNTLRKFALKFIDFYDDLDDSDKEKFKSTIESLKE